MSPSIFGSATNVAGMTSPPFRNAAERVRKWRAATSPLDGPAGTSATPTPWLLLPEDAGMGVSAVTPGDGVVPHLASGWLRAPGFGFRKADLGRVTVLSGASADDQEPPLGAVALEVPDRLSDTPSMDATAAAAWTTDCEDCLQMQRFQWRSFPPIRTEVHRRFYKCLRRGRALRTLGTLRRHRGSHRRMSRPPAKVHVAFRPWWRTLRASCDRPKGAA